MYLSVLSHLFALLLAVGQGASLFHHALLELRDLRLIRGSLCLERSQGSHPLPQRRVIDHDEGGRSVSTIAKSPPTKGGSISSEASQFVFHILVVCSW